MNNIHDHYLIITHGTPWPYGPWPPNAAPAATYVTRIQYVSISSDPELPKFLVGFGSFLRILLLSAICFGLQIVNILLKSMVDFLKFACEMNHSCDDLIIDVKRLQLIQATHSIVLCGVVRFVFTDDRKRYTAIIISWTAVCIMSNSYTCHEIYLELT